MQRLRLRRGEGRLITGKDPRIAGLLSALFPGFGQLYNGDRLKGVVMIVATLLLLITVIGPLLIAIWSLVDAVQVAGGKRRSW